MDQVDAKVWDQVLDSSIRASSWAQSKDAQQARTAERDEMIVLLAAGKSALEAAQAELRTVKFQNEGLQATLRKAKELLA